jgi:putative hydrolase of the HAD superfamily
MSGRRLFSPSDWAGIRLVAFDMDGTLYSQSRLRWRMLRDLVLHAASKRTLEAAIVIVTYRRIREMLAEAEVPDFDAVLGAATGTATGRSIGTVRAIVEEWIEHRPLRYLAACRHRGAAELFAGLRRAGKIVGIVSDYPAVGKLNALGLKADHVVCASDPRVGVLKPNPRSLEILIEAAGATPDQTVLIGDRANRDGLAATRIGAWPLIRSTTPIEGWQTVAGFDDPLFGGFLQRPLRHGSLSKAAAPSSAGSGRTMM